MSEVIDRESRLEAVDRPAVHVGLTGAGVEHQGVDLGGLLADRPGERPDAVQAREIERKRRQPSRGRPRAPTNTRVPGLVASLRAATSPIPDVPPVITIVVMPNPFPPANMSHHSTTKI
ncbi:hypothetical protein GCM10029963_64130 [Micromonospora andamanensis]